MSHVTAGKGGQLQPCRALEVGVSPSQTHQCPSYTPALNTTKKGQSNFEQRMQSEASRQLLGTIRPFLMKHNFWGSKQVLEKKKRQSYRYIQCKNYNTGRRTAGSGFFYLNIRTTATLYTAIRGCVLSNIYYNYCLDYNHKMFVISVY